MIISVEQTDSGSIQKYINNNKWLLNNTLSPNQDLTQVIFYYYE